MRKAKDVAEGRASLTGQASSRSRTAPPAPGRAPRNRARTIPPAPSGTRRKRPEAPARPRSPSPEEMLHRAMRAETPRARSLWARRGLASRTPLDRTVQSMLLRQLYLAYFEVRSFEKARDVAVQTLEFGVLPDVAHQDVARAMQALGDVDGAAGHLRLAARISPASRRAFHHWTLGSLYFLAKRYEEAISSMERAARWGTTDKPLYQGHLAVVQAASGKKVRGLGGLIERLAGVPAGSGYGRFVLGHLAFYDGRFAEARRYLEAFVAKTTGGRAAMAIALDGEVALARETLTRIPA